jgi:Domain of unknown function (DUF4864)
MNARFSLVRWLMVVLLGCGLGLLFVHVSLWLVVPRVEEGGTRGSVAVWLAAGPARLSEEAVRNELIQVIQGQLLAFRKDDYAKAYKYAASTIREQVPLPAFERMVRNGFPVIARSTSAQFGMVLDNGYEAVVNVGIVSENGRTIYYRYYLRQERVGWKITGVMRVPFQGSFV